MAAVKTPKRPALKKASETAKQASRPNGVSDGLTLNLSSIVEERSSTAVVVRAPAELVRIESSASAAVAEIACVLSPAQVRSFLGCSARWWFKHGLGLPERKNSSLAFGSAVHGALEVNFREKVETRQDLDTLGIIAVFRDLWKTQVQDIELQDNEDPSEFERLGEEIVAKYMNEVAPAIQPAAVELDVDGEIAGVRVCGRVDLLTRDGCIVDLKTAARRPTSISPDYAFQLATYRRLTPGASGRARLDTLVRSRTVQLVSQTYTIDEQDLKATEVVYPLAQAGMRSGLYFPNRQSMLCSRKHCCFWRECEREYGGTVKNS